MLKDTTPELLGAIMLLLQPALPPREVKGEVVLGTRMLIDEVRRTMVAVAGSQILAAVGKTARIATLEDLDVGLKTRSSTRDQNFYRLMKTC